MLKKVLRWLCALYIGGVGVLHFVRPEAFVAIMPKVLPAHLLLVYVSGFFEVAGSIGLLIPRTRRLASYGLMMLLVAVFPANINVAVNHIQIPGLPAQPDWAAWGRLLLQPLFIYWAWWAGRDDAPPRSGTLMPAMK